VSEVVVSRSVVRNGCGSPPDGVREPDDTHLTTEMMFVSASRRGLTHLTTDFGSFKDLSALVGRRSCTHRTWH
jgi:hypothetical protein